MDGSQSPRGSQRCGPGANCRAEVKSNGVMENWSNGVMEQQSSQPQEGSRIGWEEDPPVSAEASNSITPALHYSTTQRGINRVNCPRHARTFDRTGPHREKLLERPLALSR